MLVQSVELAQTLVLQVLSLSNVISTFKKQKALFGAPFLLTAVSYREFCLNTIDYYATSPSLFS